MVSGGGPAWLLRSRLPAKQTKRAAVRLRSGNRRSSGAISRLRPARLRMFPAGYRCRESGRAELRDREQRPPRPGAFAAGRENPAPGRLVAGQEVNVGKGYMPF